jgi:hypothetical protein
MHLYNLDVQRLLRVADDKLRIGDPSANPPTGDIASSDIDSFLTDAEEEVKDFLGLEEINLADFKNPLCWLAVAYILSSFYGNTVGSEIWEKRAKEALGEYRQSGKGVFPETAKVTTDEDEPKF